ncbi:hypothetical protein Pmani_035911 [Petrolisthes manimaculis]|uniref:Uncharacterized protein n=1 Tax=Petrolisthes manimaculis TaxID=1843537 RepID=A0AAE1NLD0_9EUCA|nr:hypothetical protein Pmani_035911 [Petrolisthes manimaculis]
MKGTYAFQLLSSLKPRLSQYGTLDIIPSSLATTPWPGYRAQQQAASVQISLYHLGPSLLPGRSDVGLSASASKNRKSQESATPQHSGSLGGGMRGVLCQTGVVLCCAGRRHSNAGVVICTARIGVVR